MPTYTQIGSAVVVGALGAANITFTSIPSTYTDLCLVVSARGLLTASYLNVLPNGSTSSLSGRFVYGNGSSTSSGSLAPIIYIAESSFTANTFGNGMVYIPNYAGSAFKSMSIDSTQENNATNSQMILQAGLWSVSTAISSITLTPDSSTIAQHSTAYLYGVSNA
jgi:hypothetical protein